MRKMVNLRLLILALMATSAHAAAAADRIIPLDTSGPRPTAQLTIAGHAPVTVIFDTGAGGSVISADFAKTLNLPNEGEVRVGSPGGQKTLPAFLTTLPAARLGDADITGSRAVVADLGVPLPGISGVMSPNIFKGSFVRFELGKSRVVVTPKTPETTPRAQPYAYEGDHPLPGIDIDVAGTKLRAHMDTGSGRGLSLPLEIAKQISLKAPLTPAKPARMAGGERAAFTSQIAGVVRIGPLTLTDPDVTFIEGIKYANVGFSILKTAVVVLDPAEQRDWLLASEASPDP